MKYVKIFRALFLLSIAVFSMVAHSITADQLFIYAQAKYPDHFKGVATEGYFQQYKYRYYAASGNYLAVDHANDIFVLGTV